MSTSLAQWLEQGVIKVRVYLSGKNTTSQLTRFIIFSPLVLFYCRIKISRCTLLSILLRFHVLFIGHTIHYFLQPYIFYSLCTIIFFILGLSLRCFTIVLIFIVPPFKIIVDIPYFLIYINIYEFFYINIGTR